MRKACLIAALLPAVASAQTPPLQILQGAQAGIDWLGALVDIVNQMIQQGGFVLVQDGFILLAFTFLVGLYSLISKMQWRLINEYHTHVQVADIIVYILKGAFCSLLLTYYMTPIPHTNLSVHQIFPALAKQISAEFDMQIVRDLLQYVTTTVQKMPAANPLNMINIFVYFFVLIQMGLIDLAIFFMNAFGFVGLGLATLIGPIFIPLLMTIHFKKLFWNWVDQMMAFSMYRVVAAAFTYMFATLMVTFFTRAVAGDYSIGNFLALLPIMFMLVVTFLWSMCRVPSITASFLNGAGAMGQGFASAVGGTVSRAVSAGVARAGAAR